MPCSAVSCSDRRRGGSAARFARISTSSCTREMRETQPQRRRANDCEGAARCRPSSRRLGCRMVGRSERRARANSRARPPHRPRQSRAAELRIAADRDGRRTSAFRAWSSFPSTTNKLLPAMPSSLAPAGAKSDWLPTFTTTNYLQFFGAGALCATATHGAMTPIDVVKTRSESMSRGWTAAGWGGVGGHIPGQMPVAGVLRLSQRWLRQAA